MVSSNPFDNEEGTFFALVNDQGQYSLWPTFAAVPSGWSVALGNSDEGEPVGVSRSDALACIEQRWTTLQPVRKTRA